MATTPRSIEPTPIQGITEGVADVGRLPARKHVLDLDDFTAGEIEQVLHTTEAMKEVLGRDIKKVPPLRGKVVMTLFYEARTRTRISFEEAGKVLSAEVINMSGPGSSVKKGESLPSPYRQWGPISSSCATPTQARPTSWPAHCRASVSSTRVTAFTPTPPKPS